MMAANDVVILQSPVDIDNKSHVISLTPTQIIVEGCWRAPGDDSTTPEPVFRRLNNLLELQEVIGVQLEQQNVNKDRFKRKDGTKVYLCIEMQQMHSNAFCVYYVKRQTKHRWRHKKMVFNCKDHSTAQMWVDKILYLLQGPEFHRPKKLLVFVNPFGGRKKGPSVYNSKVAPLFELAGISTEVIMTERQNHAKEVLQDYNLESIDGVVCVGGDGTFSEVLNGLLDRSSKEGGVNQETHHHPIQPKLRVGIIPAGSTDAIVYTSVGINDPITSAIQIIIGDSVGMDVCALYNRNQFIKYSVSMIAYGYYGDLLEDSMGLRWMGPARYNWCGFKKFLANNSYEGEVSFLLSAESESHPRDGTRCNAGCNMCAKASERNREHSTSGVTRPFSPVGADGWHKVRGKFLGINSFSMSCRTAMTPEGVSPATHLGDGCLDLCIIYNCSRIDFLRHLHRCADKQADQFDFSFIQVYRVKEFRFQPLFESDVEEAEEATSSASSTVVRNRLGHKQLKSPHNSVWNIDGELVTSPDLHVRVHTQLISLFARGVEKIGKDPVLNCPPCCTSCE
ncbi:ceramide kinase-like isoform X1 [Haliotis rubra]|uniref:ceramide kinase-like isoform X1 n=1 Tax=Haliotis rubra TaxID=36100 RepID=UPI001EE5DC0C|nr:ceramide kinase-like isoform X1 [Haliotis rubra]